MDNLGIKIVAIVLGLLLWFHVATDKQYSYELRLPVKDVLLDDSLTLQRDPPDSLLVSVSAPGKQLLRASWRDRGVRINATQYPPGRHPLALNAINTSLIGGGTEISLDEIIAPASVELYVDRQAAVTVPVTLDLTPVPDQGYAVKRISLPEPNEVTLVGARSLVGGYTTVFTEAKELSRLRNSLTLQLALLKPPGYGIRIRPDSVVAQIEIVPVKTRLVDPVPIAVFNAPPDLQVTVSPPTVAVTITGPPEEVDSLLVSSIVASVDYRTADSTGRTVAKADCPIGIKVRSLNPDTVRILVHP